MNDRRSPGAPAVADRCRRAARFPPAERGVDDGAAAVVLVAHQVGAGAFMAATCSRVSATTSGGSGSDAFAASAWGPFDLGGVYGDPAAAEELVEYPAGVSRSIIPASSTTRVSPIRTDGDQCCRRAWPSSTARGKAGVGLVTSHAQAGLVAAIAGPPGLCGCGAAATAAAGADLLAFTREG